MYTCFALLNKLPSLSTQDFIDYYENHHIPLIVSLSGDKLPLIYKRRYVQHDSPFAIKAANDGMPFDWDVATELVFEDEAGFDAWLKEIMKDGGWGRIEKDEGRFLDRGKTRSTVVREFETTTRREVDGVTNG